MKKYKFLTVKDSPWQFEFEGKKFSVTPPEAHYIKNRRLDSLPEKDGLPWSCGYIPEEVRAAGCSGAYAVDLSTVSICDENGRKLRRGRDYGCGSMWNTFWRLPGGRIGADTPVYFSCTYYLQRLDSLVRTANGRLAVRTGTEDIATPKAPELAAGEERIGNIFLQGKMKKLTNSDLFPVLEESFPAELVPPAPAARLLPETLKKLRNGGKLKIFAWGDSVTECTYMPKENGWQYQFAERLAAAFPKADIELVSHGWSGRTISAYLEEPPGSEHNYEEQILPVKADLTVVEFVNDASLPPEKWEYNFAKIFRDFSAGGSEVILIAPHYVRPDWMGLKNQKHTDKDPRPYISFLRDFTAENHIALADAALRYGRLWRQGIPYNTLMTNTINHPDRSGMKIFADALMALFDCEEKEQ